MAWTGAHRRFAVEGFFLKSGESATQRAFLAHFMLCRNDAVPDRDQKQHHNNII